MLDLTMQAILTRALAAVLIAMVQGATVARVAVWLGDPGPRHDGRTALAPAAHLDPLGAASLILFGYGWSRPVAIAPGLLRAGRAALLLPVLAASLVLAGVAVALSLLAAPAMGVLPPSGGLFALALLRTTSALCLTNAIFNLIPLPPLAGGHLWAGAGALPTRLRALLPLAMIVATGAGIAEALVGPVARALGTVLPVL